MFRFTREKVFTHLRARGLFRQSHVYDNINPVQYWLSHNSLRVSSHVHNYKQIRVSTVHCKMKYILNGERVFT